MILIIVLALVPFSAEEINDGNCTAENTCKAEKESAFMTPEEYAQKRSVVQAKLDDISSDLVRLDEELENLKKQKDQAVYDEKLMKGELAKLDAMNANLLESFKKLGGTNGALSLTSFLKQGKKRLHVDSDEILEAIFSAADVDPTDEQVEIHEFLSILASIREQKIVFRGERKLTTKSRSESALKKISDKAIDALKAMYKKIDKSQEDKALEYGLKKIKEIEGCSVDDLVIECAELVSQVLKMQYNSGNSEDIDDMLDSMRLLLLASDKDGGFLNMSVYNSLYRIWPMLYHGSFFQDLATLFHYQFSKQNLRLFNSLQAGKQSAESHMCDGEYGKSLKVFLSVRKTLLGFEGNADADNERFESERRILRLHRWSDDQKEFDKFLKKVNKKNKSKWRSDYMPSDTFKSKKLHVPVFDLEKWPQIKVAAGKLSGEGVFDGWETLSEIALPWDDSMEFNCLKDPNSIGEYKFVSMTEESCTFSKKACKYLFKNLKKKEKLKAAPAAVNFHIFTGPVKLRPWLGNNERPRLWIRLDQQECFQVSVGDQEQQLREPILTNEAFLTSLESTCEGLHGFLEVIFQGKVKTASKEFLI